MKIHETKTKTETCEKSLPRNSIRTRVQNVRYGRGNSTPYSVRMPRNQIHQGNIVRETTGPT